MENVKVEEIGKAGSHGKFQERRNGCCQILEKIEIQIIPKSYISKSRLQECTQSTGEVQSFEQESALGGIEE